MKYSKNIVMYVISLIIVGAITGFIYALNNPIELTDYLESLNSHNNVYIIQIMTIIGLFFSTLSLINFLIESLILGIEGISIGYVVGLFFQNYKIKGLLFSILSLLINKGLYLLILVYLFIINFRYIMKVLKNILGISNDYIKPSIKPLIKKYLIILLIVIINDTLIYFFGNMFLKYLTFML